MNKTVNKTYCFYSDVSCYEDNDLFLRQLKTIEISRKNKVVSYRNQNDQYLSLGAYVLLQKSLKYLGFAEKFTLLYSKKGKPYIEEFEQLHISYSHSGTKVFLVISDEEIGCDVEKNDIPRIEIAKQFFTKQEYEDCLKNNNFYRYWTIKESFTKALGQGISLPLNSFFVNFEKNIVEQNITKSVFNIKEFNLKDGYNYSLVSINPNISDIQYINLED